MKYIKPILENEKSHSVDWSSFPTLFKVVGNQLNWHDDLSQEQRDAINEMCNQLCIHAAKGLANIPNDLTLVGVELVEGPWGDSALTDMANESSSSSEAGLDLLVFPTQTGDAEFDAMYPDEKYLSVGFWFNVAVDWTNNERENTIDDISGSYSLVNVMVEGSWDGNIDAELARRVNEEITDVNEYTQERIIRGQIKKNFPA